MWFLSCCFRKENVLEHRHKIYIMTQIKQTTNNNNKTKKSSYSILFNFLICNFLFFFSQAWPRAVVAKRYISHDCNIFRCRREVINKNWYLSFLPKVQYIQQQGAKIGLKISVNAPQIIIPCNSKSKENLVADLGRLHINNSIVSSSQHGLIDKMVVRLTSFEVAGYVYLFV